MRQTKRIIQVIAFDGHCSERREEHYKVFECRAYTLSSALPKDVNTVSNGSHTWWLETESTSSGLNKVVYSLI